MVRSNNSEPFPSYRLDHEQTGFFAMQVKSYDQALDFMPAEKAEATGHGVLPAVAKFFGAIADGLAAAREYQALTNAGVASDKAARRAFHVATGE